METFKGKDVPIFIQFDGMDRFPQGEEVPQITRPHAMEGFKYDNQHHKKLGASTPCATAVNMGNPIVILNESGTCFLLS